MTKDNKKLSLKFDPNVIEHLGVRMYSTLPPVLSELIANAYDADATEVRIELEDRGKKKIVVRDNGIGMSFDDISEKFLVIGRNRREEGEVTPNGRKVIGKKGLGKLSFFGIVKTMTLNTVKDRKRTIFTMDWSDLKNSTGGQYLMTPEAVDETIEEGNSDSGTVITLTNINRKSDFSEKSIADSIARFFLFEKGFSVTVRRNDEKPVKLSSEWHFSAFGQEFLWEFPGDFAGIKSDYKYRSDITGKIITPKKPIAPRFDSRGISLFSRSKLVQSAYQFADSSSSNFFSYMTGWLNVDFIDNFDEDVISTNRRSLNWEHPETRELHKYLEECIKFVRVDWRKKRSDTKAKKINEHLGGTAIEDLISSVPEGIRGDLNFLVKTIIKDLPAKNAGKSKKIFGRLKKITSHESNHHWRRLHPSIQKALRKHYIKKDYFEAAKDAAIIYEKKVKSAASIRVFGVKLMHKSFGYQDSSDKTKINTATLPVLQIFDISTDTGKNMQNGHRSLSVGLMEAFRNPVHHETSEETKKLFSQNDCLDILSLISFLLHRLDNAKKNN